MSLTACKRRCPQWEVKDGSAEKYVTPSTNNKTIDSNAKMEKFEEHDSNGIGMSISAMSVVFCGLLLLFICFQDSRQGIRKPQQAQCDEGKGITDKQEAKEKKLGEAPGESICCHCHGHARDAKRCT